MAEDPIPPEVRGFLDLHIGSIPELELLLLLRGEPERWWTAEEAAHRIYIAPGDAGRLLAQLHAGEILLRDPDRSTYRFGPRSATLVNVIDFTARTYTRELVAVTKHVHSRQRSGTDIFSFADAFRFRKDP